MIRYIIKRLLMMIPVVLGVAILIFTIMYFTPGDPAVMTLSAEATAEDIEAQRANLGLDQPYLVQLGNFLSQVFLHGDLGTSYVYRINVTSELWQRFPRTLLIGCMSILVAVGIGIPLGVTAATHQNSFWDSASMVISLIATSMPAFWFGLMLVLIFSVYLGVLPSSGIGGIKYFILPCLANCAAGLAQIARNTRSSMLEVIRADYITTARAKGISNFKVIYKHALKNALIPVITVAGSTFGSLLGGSVLIEKVFAIPGIGSYVITAVGNRDYPVIRSSVIMLCIAFSIVMLLVDLIYAFIDPRIKSQYVGKRRGKGAKKNV